MNRRLTEANLSEPVSLHMGREYAKLHADQTIAQALASIRENPPAGRIIYFYVVGGDERLQGVVPTRRLLLGALDTPIAEIMVRNVVAIPETATVLEACEFFTLHRLLAFPVVDADRRILGVVDIDLYTEGVGELEEAERSDDLFQLVGVHLAESQQISSIAAFKSRFPWLLCNILGGILAAFLSGIYQGELERAVVLALFIPVVLALAESVSIQSVSLSLELMHGQTPTFSALLTKLRRELLTGAMLGVASATLVALVAIAWLAEPRVATCLLAGISFGVACAAVIGVAIPNVLRLLQRDPQVAAGPVSLAASDIVTLLVYFNVARLLFN